MVASLSGESEIDHAAPRRLSNVIGSPGHLHRQTRRNRPATPLIFGRGLTIESVIPIDDAIVYQTPTLLSLNGGDFQIGDFGPTKIAEVDLQTAGNGSLSLIFGQSSWTIPRSPRR
jgi:hypothetical protein